MWFFLWFFRFSCRMEKKLSAVISPPDKSKSIYLTILSSRGSITYCVALLLDFFPSDIFPSNILFFYSSLMIIFQISHCSICNLYLIVGDISELHLLFISSPRTIYFRQNSFLSKNFILLNFLSLPSDILRFSAILKNLGIFKKPSSKESMF